MAKVGRPTTYKAENAAWALKLCRLGATDADLARAFEVDIATVGRWKIAHPEFRVALKEGREVADAEVADKLFRKATGYSHRVQKPMTVSQGQNMGSSVEIVEYEEHLAPDTTACIFWLKNRRPDLWRDVQNHKVDQTLNVRTTVDLSALPDEDLETLRAILDDAQRPADSAVPTNPGTSSVN